MVMPQFHVYAVSAEAAADLAAAADAYRDRKLLPMDTADVARIEIAYDASADAPSPAATRPAGPPASQPASQPAEPLRDRPERIVLVRGADAEGHATDTWRLEAPVNTEADAQVVEDLLRGIRTAGALAFADDQAYSELGMAPPAQRISLFERGAEMPKVTLLLSRPVGTRFFARMATDQVARQFDAADLAAIDLPLLGYYQRVLVAGDLTRATRVTLERPGEPPLLAKRGEDGRWAIDQPVRCAAGEALHALIDAMGRLKANAAVADAPAAGPSTALAAYGLDKPELVLSVVEPQERPTSVVMGEQPPPTPQTRPAEITYTIRVGAQVADSTDRYARVDGRDVIYRIGPRLIEAAGKELRDDRVLSAFAGAQAKDADGLEVTRGGSTVALTRVGAAWQAASPKAFEAEAEAVDAAATSLLRLAGEGFTAVTEPAALGLAEPALRVRLEGRPAGAPPVSAVVLVGAEFTTEIDGEPVAFRYCQTEGETVARHVRAEALADLMRGHVAYMPRRMIEVDAEKQRVTGLSVKRPDLSFVAEPVGDPWKLTEPVEEDAGWGVATLVRELSALRAERVVADATADLAAYGLDTPAYQATLTIAPLETPEPPPPPASAPASRPSGETVTLRVGAPVDPAKPDGSRFAMIEGRSLVYQVGHALVERLDAPIRKDGVFGEWPMIETVSITRGNERFTLVKTAAGDAEKYFITTDGSTADAKRADCQALFDALRQMTLDRYVLQRTEEARLAEFGLDAPAIRVEVTERDNPPVVVEVGALTPETAARSLPDQRYYARRLGSEGVFTLKAPDVAGLLKPAIDYIDPSAASRPAAATRPAGEE
jgi:hypothetical protein